MIKATINDALYAYLENDLVTAYDTIENLPAVMAAIERDGLTFGEYCERQLSALHNRPGAITRTTDGTAFVKARNCHAVYLHGGYWYLNVLGKEYFYIGKSDARDIVRAAQ